MYVEEEVDVDVIYEEDIAEAYEKELKAAVAILRTIPVELHTLLQLSKK